VDLLDLVLLALAAVGAGAMNAIVGAGTLITFPVILALGYPPVTANVSNTVGLVPGSVTAAFAFRGHLRAQWPLVRKLVVASMLGGITGGALLLALPPGAFEVVVPILLALAGILAAVQPRVADAVARRRERVAPGERLDPNLHASPLLLAGVAATGIYGGYFGAAQGVVLLALLGVFVPGGMTQVNGIKNVLAGVANLVSALLFIAIADVEWAVAATVAVGATIGGGLGGRYGRRLPSRPLRVAVVVIAFTAAAWQFAT
jgi:uncharacterized protein